MERRLLIVLVWTTLAALGCSKAKSPPPTAAAPAASAPADASSPNASFDDAATGIGGLGFSGTGSGGGSGAGRISGPSSEPAELATSSAAAAPATEVASADEQRQLKRQRTRAEEVRRRVLDELDRATVLGAFGSPTRNPGESPHPLAPADALDQNPLRGDALPPVPAAPAEPATGNPLRQARREPRIPATPASPSPSSFGPPATEFAPGSGVPSADHSPSGGSAPPTFGSAAPPGGVPLEPQATPPSGPASAEPSGGSVPPLAVVDAPKMEPPPIPSDDESQFDVVEVLYGTDRQAGEQLSSDWTHLLMQFLPTVTIGLLAACLIVIAVGRKSWFLGTIATIGFAGCALLGYDAIDEVLSRIRGAVHQGPRYTTDRSPAGRIELGRCEVTVPRSHAVAELEAPSILRLEINEELSRHLILQKTQRLASIAFHDLLRNRVERSARRELFVFVHGFNVSFEDAARRTAQIHYDLKFDGAPVFFSWPANDKFIFTYPADETNVAWSVPHLKQFLLEIVKESRAQSINLIAHSMGNRALAAALREIDLEMHDQARLFNQVILAAPDIDADDFRNNIAPAMQRTARGLTLYASSHDEALLASQFIHRRPRAGDAGDGLTVIPGIDTIDVTAIDQSLWGHSYYGSSHPVLQDLRALLSRAVPPRDRTWLSPAERDGLTYWIFQPTRTAAAESNFNR